MSSQPITQSTGGVTPKPKPDVSDLKKKCKQKRQLMQQVRTNQCSMNTLENLPDMDSKLQTQVIQQLKMKNVTETKGAKSAKPRARRTKGTKEGKEGKPRSKGKKPGAATNVNATENSAEPVTQSTADTNESIQDAKYQVIMTVFEKHIEEACGDNQALQTEAQKGLSILKDMLKNPDIFPKINQQLSQWSRQGSLPTMDSIKAFINELLQLHYKKTTGQPTSQSTEASKSYKFAHDTSNPF